MGKHSDRPSHTPPLTRRVLGAMGMFGSVEFLTMACGVVRTKLVAIFIGTVGVGLIGLYANAIELLSTLAQLGLRTTAVRDIASANPATRPSIIAIVRRYSRYLALIGVVLEMVLSPLLSYITFGSFSHTPAFIALALAVGANTLVAGRGAELQGEGKLKSLARASLWATLISLILVAPMIVVWGLDSVVPLLLAYGLVSLVAYTVVSRRSEPLPDVDGTELKQRVAAMVKLGAFLTVSGAASWLAGYVVMSAINRLGGSEEMGLYQAGYTLTVRYVGVVFTALSLEYFPRLTAALTSGRSRGEVMLRHETIISVLVIAALASLMVVCSPWIVKLLYSDSFLDVVPMIVVGAPGVVMRAISWAMAYVIVGSGRGRLFMATELVSCVICVAAMVVGYYLGGMAGVGAGFTLWYSFYTLMVWIVTRRSLSVTLGCKVWSVCWGAILSVGALSVMALMLPLWLTVPAGCLLAVGWLLGLKRMLSQRPRCRA